MRQDEIARTDSTFDPVNVLLQVARRFGIDRLARSLGKSDKILYAKLNESVDNKTPSLREAVAITDESGDASLLEAWARHLGGVFIRLPAATAGEDDLLDDLIEVNKSLGEVAAELRDARKDGVIDPAEFKRLAAAVGIVHAKLTRLQVDIETQVREIPKATPLRATA